MTMSNIAPAAQAHSFSPLLDQLPGQSPANRARSLTFNRIDATDHVVLVFRGVLDAMTAPDIRDAVAELAAGRVQLVVIDVSQLRSIDSSGVAVLVSLFKQMRSRHATMRLVGLVGQPLDILKLLRLDHVLVVA